MIKASEQLIREKKAKYSHALDLKQLAHSQQIEGLKSDFAEKEMGLEKKI